MTEGLHYDIIEYFNNIYIINVSKLIEDVDSTRKEVLYCEMIKRKTKKKYVYKGLFIYAVYSDLLSGKILKIEFLNGINIEELYPPALSSEK